MDSRIAFIAGAPLLVSSRFSSVSSFAAPRHASSSSALVVAKKNTFLAGDVPMVLKAIRQFAFTRNFEIRADDAFEALKEASSASEAKQNKFGMVQFAEQFNGRAAMLGFVLGLVTEYLTGEGIFEQVGLVDTKSQLLFLLALTTTSALFTLLGYVLYQKQQEEKRLNKY
uniref:Stress-enhanced protein 5 n=1 Tax=Glaucocystis nostochinearum TaxID=38271 RepID=D9PTQ8_9EUKA|nr:TPA_inf: stress-enhanced protein 5 [Glaucocystis nostochinearum]